MGWTVWACDTVTGEKLGRLPVSAFDWERVLGGGGQGSFTVPYADTDVKRLDLDTLTAEASTTLVLDRDGAVVYAGIVTATTYDYDTDSYSGSHHDLWWILERRLAADTRPDFIKDTVQTYTGLSLGTIAKRVMALAMVGPANDNPGLPVTLPADATDSTGTRKYYGYHLKYVTDVFDELASEDDGPDIDFQPRWVSGKLNWLMRVGTPASPDLSGSTWEWNLTAPERSLRNVKRTLDAAKMGTAFYAVGEGQGVDGHFRSNRVLNPSVPTLHKQDTYSQESNDDVLARIATAGRDRYEEPTSQWTATMPADGRPSVADLQLGDTAKFWTDKRPKISAGWKSNRVIGFSGDLGEWVDLRLQPSGGA